MAQQSVQENISVLFIGNSYTFMNDMPFMFQKMAQAEGVNAYVDTVVHGGKNLQYHASRKETYDKIRSRNWTYVIIQGHSNEFAAPKTEIEKKTRMYLSQIIDSVRINNNCTKIALYMTWAYNTGNKNWEPIDTYEKMQNKVGENYMWMARDFNTVVSPVGFVWQDVRTKMKNLNLYAEDGKHPNLYGSYIAASTFLLTITKKSPVRNAIQLDINPETKEFIEREVFAIVSDYQKWRNFADEVPVLPGFDVVVTNKKVQLFDNSRGGLEVSYKVNNTLEIDELNPEFMLPKKTSSLIIQQEVREICKSYTLTRKIELE